MYHGRHGQDLLAGRPYLRLNLDQCLANVSKIGTEVVRYARVGATQHLAVQTCHVICSEGRPQRDTLVQDAAQGPDVALHVVGLISPDLGRSVIRCTGLRVEEAPLRDLGDVHVAELGRSIFVQENVGTLQISMENV